MGCLRRYDSIPSEERCEDGGAAQNAIRHDCRSNVNQCDGLRSRHVRVCDTSSRLGLGDARSLRAPMLQGTAIRIRTATSGIHVQSTTRYWTMYYLSRVRHTHYALDIAKSATVFIFCSIITNTQCWMIS
jgi:hypothetical protein